MLERLQLVPKVLQHSAEPVCMRDWLICSLNGSEKVECNAHCSNPVVAAWQYCVSCVMVLQVAPAMIIEAPMPSPY